MIPEESDRMDDLLVCSHRGPFSYKAVNGSLKAKPGNGGVVNVISAIPRQGGRVTWLACALSESDRQAAAGRQPANHGDGDGIGVRLLDFPDDLHRSFYDDACVTGLGFIFHGLVDQAYTPAFDSRFSRGWAAYQEINHGFAAEVAATAGEGPVLVEDYHLMFVADALRETGRRRPGPTAYFHHVPWCPPTYFALLPRVMRTQILARLLAFDTLGFHARRWADAFLACCDEFLPGAQCEPDLLRWRGREVPVVVAPAPVDVPHLQEVVSGQPAERWRRRLSRLIGPRRVIVRADRVDLWKNIIRGFLAFERLVVTGQADDVVFVALLVRSRTHLPEYRKYLAACQREARRINQQLDPGGPGVIHLLLTSDSDHSRALAGLSLADVVLVNSTSDGLNLVAKETAIAGASHTRLVLSEMTGAHEQVGRWAYSVNPFDIDQTCAAMARALREKGDGAELRAAVAGDSPESWIRQRLARVPVAAG
jgi:trehalose 6-phosphate synthase